MWNLWHMHCWCSWSTQQSLECRAEVDFCTSGIRSLCCSSRKPLSEVGHLHNATEILPTVEIIKHEHCNKCVYVNLTHTQHTYQQRQLQTDQLHLRDLWTHNFSMASSSHESIFKARPFFSSKSSSCYSSTRIHAWRNSHWFAFYSPNSTWLVTSQHDTMHFGWVKLVKQHGSTHSTRLARHVELEWLNTFDTTSATVCCVICIKLLYVSYSLIYLMYTFIYLIYFIWRNK